MADAPQLYCRWCRMEVDGLASTRLHWEFHRGKGALLIQCRWLGQGQFPCGEWVDGLGAIHGHWTRDHPDSTFPLRVDSQRKHVRFCQPPSQAEARLFAALFPTDEGLMVGEQEMLLGEGAASAALEALAAMPDEAEAEAEAEEAEKAEEAEAEAVVRRRRRRRRPREEEEEGAGGGERASRRRN